MVKILKTIITIFFLQTGAVMAVLPQSASDLEQMKDILRFKIKDDVKLKDATFPTLVTIPRHYWVESKSDFATLAIQALQEVFPDPGSLILCQECDTHRAHSAKEQRLHVHNGELSLMELRMLKEDPRFRDAKSLTRIKETPSGVSVLITSLEDGRILFTSLADSSRNLDDIRSWRPFAQEMERRQRGESLYYVFINLGLMQPLVQVEWVEQWGSRNQHISGVIVSLINPIAAVGVVYHYMLPAQRRVHFGLALLYPLQNFAKIDDKNDTALTKVVFQGSAHYAISGSFGLMASVNSTGGYSLGMNFFNPILMPFLF